MTTTAVIEATKVSKTVRYTAVEFRVPDWQLVLRGLLVLGIALRLYHFFDNRSMWIDETFLVNSLIRMSFAELVQPALEYEQKAPVGILWLMRLSVLLFGKGEMALRLVPLLCGIASLVVFVPTARSFLKPSGVAVALGILAVAPPLVYHAVEAKHYSSGLLATVVVLWLYTRYQGRTSLADMVKWGICGAVVVWFSYAAIFVLMGMAAGVMLAHLAQRNWKRIACYAIPFGLWLFSFALNYVLITGKYTESGWLLHWFRIRDTFMPMPPFSVAGIKWIFFQLYMMLDYPLGLLWADGTLGSNLPRLIMRGLPLLMLLAGQLAFFRQRKQLYLVLTMPLVLTLLASGLEKYPFYERLLVFMAPLLILIVARGCVAAAAGLRKPWRYALVALLVAPALHASARQVADTNLFGGYKKSYFKECFLHIDAHYQPGDVVYIYWNQLPAYRYYKEVYPFRYEAVTGADLRPVSHSLPEYLDKAADDFVAKAGNKRAWFVINDLVCGIGEYQGEPGWYYEEGVNFGERIRDQIATKAKLIGTYHKQWGDAYLFDMSGK